MPLPWLETEPVEFPPLEQALEDPNGLLAAGGALTPQWLLHAYKLGIFPWYETGQPILWWSPDPRLVLYPHSLKVSRSLRKLVRNNSYTITMDRDFAGVIRLCSEPREADTGTWITSEMEQAYCELHRLGHAHSVEIWAGDTLAGGLYGVAVGKVFFGESMFSRSPNTSKLALVALVRQLEAWGFELIDCQVSSEHLMSLGAEEISRSLFSSLLQKYTSSSIQNPSLWNYQTDVPLIDEIQ